MKYAFLVYSDESALHDLPESPHDRECAANVEAMIASGHWVIGEALKPVETATTVRVRSGRSEVVDGPFAETREQLAGFHIVEARDLDEALALAARIPAARVGSVEVRPLRELQVD